MKFLLLCETKHLSGEMSTFVNNFPRNHELVTVTPRDLLEGKALPENLQGIMVERNSWQKNFSLFRYFRILPNFEALPFAIVSRGRKQEALKGRAGCKEVYFSAGAGPEEVFATLDRFISTPVTAYSFPKGSSRA